MGISNRLSAFLVFLIGLSLHVNNIDAQKSGLKWLGISDFAAWSPDGSKIVFQSSRDGNFEIYIMDASGENQKRLTTNAQSDIFPVFSPDGSKIAFSSNQAVWFDSPAFNQIYTMNIDGSNIQNLTNGDLQWLDPNVPASNNFQPYWLKNGQISFLSNRGNGWSEVYIMDEDGSNVMRITYDQQHHYNMFWSPDNQRIYFDVHGEGFSSALGDGGWDIYSVNSNGVARTNVTNDPNHEDYDGDISPDGKKIVFLKSGKKGLYIKNVDGTGTETLFYDGHAMSPDWSPDGSKIVFTSARDGHREIYVLDVKTMKPKRLTWSR